MVCCWDDCDEILELGEGCGSNHLGGTISIDWQTLTVIRNLIRVIEWLGDVGEIGTEGELGDEMS